MLHTNFVKNGYIVLEKKMLSHDDGRQPIAIDNLSVDLKMSIFRIELYLTMSKYLYVF